MQGNDESTAVTQYKEKYEEVIAYLFGFVGGVLAIVLIRFVAGYMLGGRYAKPLVICVEVGTQVDLLTYEEELVDDLNSRLMQPELVALAGLFGRFPGVRARKTVIAKEVAQTGLVSGYVGAPGTACAC